MVQQLKTANHIKYLKKNNVHKNTVTKQKVEI